MKEKLTFLNERVIQITSKTDSMDKKFVEVISFMGEETTKKQPLQ